MPTRSHIGLEIADTEFRMMELRADDDGPVISYAVTQQTEFNYASPLLHEAPYNRKIAKAFIKDLSSLFHHSTTNASRVSIALPASTLLVSTFPIDPHLSEAEKKEQLEWECQTLYGVDTETKLDVHSFVLSATEDAEMHLAASMPNQTSEFLKSVFAQLAFTVNSIDVNQFIVENHLHDNTPGIASLAYAVFGLFEEFCTVGVYDRGKYYGFRQSSMSFREGYFAQALRLLQSILGDDPELNLEAVYVYGSASTQPLLDSLRTLLEIPVRKFDPRKGVPFLNTQCSNTVMQAAAHVYDIPFSAALSGNQ
jgi:Tfp pilus assembly PilM family ATPase